MTAKAESKIMQYLIEQCKNPSGFIGNSMLDIWNRTFMTMARWGLNNTSLNRSDTILEIGCGGGAFIHYLIKERLVNQVYGIDISESAIEKTKKLNEKFLTREIAELSCISAESMQFESNKFNHIFAIQTHIYWENIEKVLLNVYPSLVEGGELNLICEKDKIKYHLTKFSESEAMERLLRNAGFAKVDIYETSKWIQYRGLKN
ncbi:MULTISPECIES: class I SAM-dependent methyltransferase [unclassified Enterococcus]|uniref:class I SAM-dependent methyltransferase n=1 Tax=unclassified Enterococcus TaxID=2608891 RepID=UPI001555F09D|nr:MULTISPECIES: class I SAM-dependent methyltransferase [unclassified Enterococcus]MBS7577342.1 class I SAM-dependent methyltransferase [Enterococcus sp. MMGLQ5-2]MBS7584749.1 class I SAM-dependent methyltransferase [Enterococcus sp. MMGLQ5-1]NPD12604.1 class I SAM-dependent methyltransferase [Enterococcus sp. MMGLQ5-1]NPD37176.1 class I SAM-dependent methyltransferase [Enterococcus sp. MMGLQ5-2]